VAGGAGERPAKSSLTSPVFVLPDCSPLWRAFARLTSKCSTQKGASRPPQWSGDCLCARSVSAPPAQRGQARRVCGLWAAVQTAPAC
jgi:hypothetical protein